MNHELILCQENLRYVREYILCISIAEASRRSGLSYPTVEKAESGGSITARTFQKLCLCYETEYEKNMARAAIANGSSYTPALDSQKDVIEKELLFFKERKRKRRR